MSQLSLQARRRRPLRSCALIRLMHSHNSDTQYALIENAGVKMRMLDNQAIARFPANGFIALEETLRTRRSEAVALVQGYAKGTIFALANAEAAVRLLYKIFPQSKPTGRTRRPPFATISRSCKRGRRS